MKRFCFKLVLTLAAFWLALKDVDFSDLRDSFMTQNPVFLGLAALGVVVQIIFGALRWHSIRRALEPDLHGIIRSSVIYYMSSFFNIAMPSTLGGDAARVVFLKKDRVSMKDALFGVVLDRIIALLGMLAVVASTTPILCDYFGISRMFGFAVMALFWGGLIAGYALLGWLLPRLAGFLKFAWVNDILIAIQTMLKRRGLFIASLLAAIIAHIAYAGSAYALSQGLHMDISFIAILTLVPMVLLLTTLPISLGGWGIREMGMVHSLALIGIPGANALLLSLQLGMVSTIVSLGGGLVYLLGKK